jgi:hypothetical protein
MTRTLIWIGVLLTGGLIVAAAAYVILIFDPFKWGVVQSDKFTWQKFSTVKEGDKITSVVDRLGQPVWPAEDITLIRHDPSDPCVSEGCKKYVFAGAFWGATFKEAIVIADPKENVIFTEARQE